MNSAVFRAMAHKKKSINFTRWSRTNQGLHRHHVGNSASRPLGVGDILVFKLIIGPLEGKGFTGMTYTPGNMCVIKDDLMWHLCLGNEYRMRTLRMNGDGQYVTKKNWETIPTLEAVHARVEKDAEEFERAM